MAWVAEGALLRAEGELAPARALLEELKVLHPDGPYVRVTLGAVLCDLAERGRPELIEEAELHTRRA